MSKSVVLNLGGWLVMLSVFVVSHSHRSVHSLWECSHMYIVWDIVSGVLSFLQNGHIFCMIGKVWCSVLFGF
jgi:phosphatidate phosphatase PAH1